jgi:DNA-binding NarL/FixJ family response regulator
MKSSAQAIVIADNQFLIVRSLQQIILERTQLTVSHVIDNRSDLEQAISGGTVSLLIIDISHFDFDSISDFRTTLSLNHTMPVLVLTNSLSRKEINELNSIGVRSILFKSAAEDELVTAINRTLEGKKYHGREVMEILMEPATGRRLFQESTTLTGSETEIVRLIAEGLTTKEIATRKHLSFHTIMTHRKNIFRKLKVNNASELVMFAIRSGIIDTIEYQI